MKSTYVLVPVLAAFMLVGCGSDNKDDASLKDPSDTSTTGASTASAKSDAAASAGPYKVKSGILESTVDFMGVHKVTTYFDDFGAKQTTVTAMEMMGQKIETIQIQADGWMYSYDPAKKEGTKVKSPAMTSASGLPDLATLTDEMKTAMKLVDLDDRTIAGKETNGMQLEAAGMPMKTWVWEGIPMRTEVEMGGKKPMVTEVTKIDVDVAVPADRFVVPADIKIKELGK